MVEIIVDDITFNMKEEGKAPYVDRVCPLCRTFGKTLRCMDMFNDNPKVSITMYSCLTCRGVYTQEYEFDIDEKPVQ